MSADSVSVHKKPTHKNPESRWRTISLERIYGQKLLNALKTANNSSKPSKLSPSSAVKEASDSALALTAKGQTRWSRAILSRQWQKHKFGLKVGVKIRRPAAPRCPTKSGPGSGRDRGPEKEESVRDRLRVLSRLVPGARMLSTSTLLEEAADYVAALEMQVKTMRALADLLATTSISTPSDEN